MPKVCTLFRQWANNFWAACEWGCDCISICVWSITWRSRNYYSACCSTAQTNQTHLEEAAWSTLKSSNQIITTGRLFIPVQLRTTFTKPFLVIIYEHRSLLRPTHAWIQHWKTVEVREKKQGVSSKQLGWWAKKMPHAPVQVHVRLKNNFALPINTEPTSAILVQGHEEGAWTLHGCSRHKT